LPTSRQVWRDRQLVTRLPVGGERGTCPVFEELFLILFSIAIQHFLLNFTKIFLN
jgi:hypothetical protein